MAMNLYHVKPGDQLFAIMQEHYGTKLFSEQKSDLIQAFNINNPHIKDMNLIYPNQVLNFPDFNPEQTKNLKNFCAAPDSANDAGHVAQALEHSDPASRDFFFKFDVKTVSSIAKSGFTDVVQKSTDAAIHDIRKIGLNYYQMHAGTITRGSYDYRRRVSIKKMDHKLGPLRQLISPGKTNREIIRIDKGAEVRTQNLVKEINNLNRIRQVAKFGGVVFKSVEIGATVAEVHKASSNEERTVIVVDAIGSTGGALAGAAAMGAAIVLVGTPVGWLALAGIGVASIAGGAIGEALAGHVASGFLYDKDGNRLNTKADRIWNSFYD